MKLMWSRFAHFYKNEKTKVLFHALNYSMFRINFDVIPSQHRTLSSNEMRALSNNLMDKLSESGLLIKTPEEDRTLLDDVLLNFYKFNINNLRLLVTNKCNMHCTYCQIRNVLPANNSNLIMTHDTVKRAVDLFENSCVSTKDVTITFTGGEPLVAMDAIKSAVRYIKSKNSLTDARMVVFTNGIKLNKNNASYFRDNNFLVIVSLDGPSRLDKRRTYASPPDDFQKALNGYLLAREAGCNCAISSVANLEDNYNFDEWLDWVTELNPFSVGLNYPHQLLNEAVIDTNFTAYTAQILKGHKVLSKRGIFMENYGRFSKAFNANTIRWKECQATGRGITVDPEGFVGPCKSLLSAKIIAYPLDNFDLKSNAVFNEWAGRTPLSHEDCLCCPALGICGGGCAYDAYCIYNGKALNMDKRMCNHVCSIFHDLIQKRLNSTSAGIDNSIKAREATLGIVNDSVGH